MNHWMMLATAGAVDAETVGYIIAAVVVGLGGGAGGAILTRRIRTDKNEPLDVRLVETFLPRTEFQLYKAEQRSDMQEIKGIFQRVFDRIDERDAKLSEAIERTGTNAYNGRAKIWDALSKTGERVAAVEATCKAQHPPRPRTGG